MIADVITEIKHFEKLRCFYLHSNLRKVVRIWQNTERNQ
nr:MAG TPA: hypothetical protein [Caudoviricetes sp.]